MWLIKGWSSIFKKGSFTKMANKEKKESESLNEVKLDYTTWIVNNVLPDELFFFEDNFNVQDFLKKQGCFLQYYRMSDNQFYSDWLMKKCKEKNINTKVILCTLQKEQSIISMRWTPPERVMDRALGFGMTDAGDIKKYYGFENQNNYSIDWFVNKYSDTSTLYKSKKLLKITVDQNFLEITPLNAFTYILYLYTPWTGSPDSIFYNKWGSHGVYLFWRVWKMYWYDDLKKYKHITLNDIFSKEV